jgi:hypothetical protein
MKSLTKLKMSFTVAMVMVLIGCGSGSGSSTDNSSNNSSSSGHTNNDSTDSRKSLRLVNSYTIPTVYGQQNVLLDGENVILAGGQTGRPAGGTYDGSPLFSNKIIKLNLLSGARETLEMNAKTGHFHDGGDKGNGGRGNMVTVIHKIGVEKYLISGGFQYVNSMEIVDFNTNSVKQLTSSSITDESGLNTTAYYANRQGYAEDNYGNIYFFGFNNGLYGMSNIIKFDKDAEKLMMLDVNLTMARAHAFAHKLSDGKIIIIGGWDGSSKTTSDSATRRVELFDPEALTIKRLSDFPEPVSNHGSKGTFIVGDNKVCASFSYQHMYQYNMSQNSWSSGCDINITTFSSDDYIFPENSLQGQYLGSLENGEFVFINNGRYSDTFSDQYNGYPIEVNTTIDVYEIVE